VSLTAPSAVLCQLGGLEWSAVDPTWLHDGQVVMAYIGRMGLFESHMLVVREDWLRAVLHEHHFALMVAVQGERRHVIGDGTYRQPYMKFKSVVSFDAQGDLRFAEAAAETHTGGAN
jgi:hypothetical protein